MSAAVETVWSAFKRLSRTERQEVIGRLLQDPELREDLIDLALVEERQGEPSRPLREYLAKREKKRD
jgi:hypothetical protein